MKKLDVLRGLLDVDVSSHLQEHVRDLANSYDEDSHHQRYKRMAEILDLYRAEKGATKGAEPWSVLSILVTALVGTTWCTGRFTYYFHIGRSEIASAIWELADEEGAPCFVAGRCKTKCWLSSIQKAHEHAKKMHRYQDITLLDAWNHTIARVVEINRARGTWQYRGLFGDSQWNQICKLDGLPLKPPSGQRKTHKQAPRKTKVKREPKQRRMPVREKKLVTQLRSVFAKWLDERIKTLPDEVRDLEWVLAKEEFERTIHYIQAQTLEGLTEVHLLDQHLYTQACRVLGVEPPKKGLIRIGAIRSSYRVLVRRLHEDHNPGLDPEKAAELKKEYQAVVESYKFIQAYIGRN